MGGVQMTGAERIKANLVEVGRRLYSRGLVAASDGNISARIGDDQIVATPTGVSKGYMSPEMLITLNLDGKKLCGTLKPSSELMMHLEVYRQRPDVLAVVHAHPPVATAFAVAGKALDSPVLPEIILTVGTIPLAKYGTPSTEEVPASIRPYLEKHDALLLKNHGALTLGTDLFNALYKMESIEHFAIISLYAELLGGEQGLPPEEVKKLLAVRVKMGIAGRHPWV